MLRVLMISCLMLPTLALALPTSVDSSAVTAKGKKGKKKKKKGKKKNHINAMLERGAAGVTVGIRPSNGVYYEGDRDHSFSKSVDMGLTIGGVYDKAVPGVGQFLSYSIGGQYRVKGGGDSGLNRHVEFKTIEFPVTLKARFPVTNKIMPYLTVGFFGSFAFDTAAFRNGKQSKTEEDKWSGFDYGLVFGAGSFFTIQKGLIAGVNLTYNYGRYNILSVDEWQKDNLDLADTDTVYTEGVLLNASIQF